MSILPKLFGLGCGYPMWTQVQGLRFGGTDPGMDRGAGIRLNNPKLYNRDITMF